MEHIQIQNLVETVTNQQCNTIVSTHICIMYARITHELVVLLIVTVNADTNE